MVNTKLDLGLLHISNNLVLKYASLILPPQEKSLHIPATYNFQILTMKTKIGLLKGKKKKRWRIGRLHVYVNLQKT